MAKFIKVCLARIPVRKTTTREERLALLRGYKWPMGKQIRVRFMEGDASLRKKVETSAKIWTQFANISLLFGDEHDVDIRVAFKQDGTSWSAIGTDCLSIGLDEPTVNFGWLTPQSSDDEISRVVLHEFGHALGCVHEHMSPAGGINWDKPAVYNYYANLDPPWSQQKVDQNIFNTYSVTQTSYTSLDPTSIMMYPIPKELTTDGYEVGLNKTLSETDKDFIRQEYP